jgi:hypothetical protein
MLSVLDPTNLTIPLISETGWKMLHRIFQNPMIGRLRDVGAAPTSGEIIFNQAFRRYLTDDPRATLILRGSHVQRWEIVEEAKQGEPVYLKKTEYLRGASRESKAYHFQHPRVVYQECAAIDNWRRIIAAYLPAGNFCGHKICYFTDYQCAPLVFLAIFDSRLLDYVVTALSTNNSLPAYLIGSLPFPRFSLDDAPPSRSAHLSQLKHMYAEESSEQNVSAIVEAIAKMETSGSYAPAAAHDFLAYLAGEMISLHKQKQTLVKQFLSGLEAELKIRPDREGNSGIDALSGKTTVKKYLGDYQKREPSVGFSGLWEVLSRNRMRFGRTPDHALEDELRKRYSENLARLLPIKSRLAATDQLIDRIVYHLYGVREEERAMMEAGSTDATPAQAGKLVE